MQKDCPFCSIPKDRIIIENNLAYAVRDRCPVTSLHSLVITKRHVSDYFLLTKKELLACDELINRVKDDINKMDKNVNGFNLGTNIGSSAGQKIFHFHIHLIPRRSHDINPYIRWS